MLYPTATTTEDYLLGAVGEPAAGPELKSGTDLFEFESGLGMASLFSNPYSIFRTVIVWLTRETKSLSTMTLVSRANDQVMLQFRRGIESVPEEARKLLLAVLSPSLGYVCRN